MDKSLYEFGKEMSQVIPKFMREALKRFSKAVSRGDITILQISILSFLKESSRSKMSDIAKLLSVTTSAATGAVDRMVRSNLLKRVANEEDRRVVNIEITNKARKIIDDIEKARYKMLMNLFSKIPPLERKRYLKTIKKLYAILIEEQK